MTDLISKLEAATEGSVEFDHEIGKVVGRLPLKFSRSIDAALTLVTKQILDGANRAAFLHAVMWQQRIGDIPDEQIPLAICIAALKAREKNQ